MAKDNDSNTHDYGGVGGNVNSGSGSQTNVEVKEGGTAIINPPVPAPDLDAALKAYLTHIIANTHAIDPRGILQTNRQVLMEMDEVYIHLNAEREAAPADADRRLMQQLDDIRTRSDLKDDQREQMMDDLMLRRDLAREQRVTVSLDIAARDHACMVVLGDPGAGKTTLLRYLAYNHAKELQQAIKDKHPLAEQRLPIYVRIAEYAEAYAKDKLPIAKYLAAYCQSHACEVPPVTLAALFDDWLKRGQCLVLLDGFDEITDPSERTQIRNRIEEFVQAHASVGNRFAITSRIAGYRAAPFSTEFAHYTILDMGKDEIATFLRQWCPAVERFLAPDDPEAARAKRAQDEIDGILAALNTEGVARLAANPLLLTLLALIHRSGNRLPDRRIELYKLAAETMINRWLTFVPGAKGLLTEAEVIKVLSPLAYCMHANRPSGVITEGEVYRSMGRTLAAMRGISDLEDPELQEIVKKFLRSVREATGLFVERAPKRYGFMHLTFEEYFAARYLVQRAASRLTLLRRHLHDPRWLEPILLALGFLSIDYPDEAGELLYDLCLDPEREPSPHEDLLHRDLLFALRACGDGIMPSPRVVKKLVDDVLEIYFDKDRDKGKGRFRLLREQISAMFSNLSGGKVGVLFVNSLLALLTDSDDDVRITAINALGTTGTDNMAVVDAMLGLLADTSPGVRGGVADALGSVGLGNSATIDALFRLLADFDPKVRRLAAEALGKVAKGNTAVIETLVDSLLHPDADVRSSVVTALGNVDTGNPMVIDALLELLNDSSSEARTVSVDVLGKIAVSNHAVANALLPLLNDPGILVRGFAVTSLSRVRASDPFVFEALLRMSNDNNIFVRCFAILALEEIGVGNPEAITTLLHMLNDSNNAVRDMASEALGRIGVGNTALVEALLSLITNPDISVSSSAAASLIECGAGGTLASDKLLTMLDSGTEYVRQHAIQELTRRTVVQGSTFHHGMKSLLKDGFADVRRAAIASFVACTPHSQAEQTLRELAQGPSISSGIGEIYDDAYAALYELATKERRVPADPAICPDIKPAPSELAVCITEDTEKTENMEGAGWRGSIYAAVSINDGVGEHGIRPSEAHQC